MDEAELGEEVTRAIYRENEGAAKWRRAHVEYRAVTAVRRAERRAASDALWTPPLTERSR